MNDPLSAVSDEFEAARADLYAFIFGLVRNSHDAHDILQEVWVRASESVRRGEEIRDLGGWCRGVGRNLVLHYWRDRSANRLVASDNIADLADRAFAEATAREASDGRGEALGACLESMQPAAREVLELKYDGGLSFVQIAEKVHKSVSSLMVQVHRLRKWLKECIEGRLRRDARSEA